MFVPLLFWCNLDPRLAIASVAIPFGQRYINVTLASAADMCGYVLRGSGIAGNTTLSSPTIATASLYINNIFVNPEIHKIYIKRLGFTLIRVRRYQIIPTSLSTQETLLQQLKWPIESLEIGLRPTSQKTSLRDWHKFCQATDTTYALPNIPNFNTTHATVTPTALNAAANVAFTWGQADATAVVEAQTIDNITITAHGVYLYNNLPSGFFSNYTQFTYGGANMQSSDDLGVCFIPFNLYPGTYQPSGHVNVSRAREFYFSYVSSVIGQNNPGEVVINGTAINFLLISDGSAVLRYST